MKLQKPLLIASLSAAVALGAVSTKANAADPVLGALIGGGIGAAIGHDINHRNGGAAGAVVGALVGSSIAASSNYYNDGYYGPAAPAYGYSAPAPAYGYAPAPSYGYYAPPPYYYAAPVIGASIVYGSGPRYYGPRHHYRGHRHW